MFEFSSGSGWKDFYESFELSLTGDNNSSGWISCKCPIHPHEDKSNNGGINIYSGNYRCFSVDCVKNYRSKIGTRPDSSILTPREFLIISHGLTNNEAYLQVEAFKSGLNPDIAIKEKFIKTYRANPEFKKVMEEAQEKFRNNYDADVIQEYCISRDLTPSTLEKFGAGYFSEQDCLLLPYILEEEVVGIRARDISGNKTAAKGSYSCLFNLDNAIKSVESVVIVVEGETDCMYLSQLLWENSIYLPVVSTPGAYYKKEWKRFLNQFKQILVIPQDDDASAKLVSDISAIYKNKISVIQLPWRPGARGKDIVDFCKQHKSKIIPNLINQYIISSTKKLMLGNEFIEYSKEKIPYLIPGLLERNTKTLISGEPKTFKTWVALQLMDSVLNNKPLFGMASWLPVEKNQKVMLIEEEGARHRMSSRLNLVTGGEGLDRVAIIHRQGIKLDDTTCVSELIEDILEFKPDLIVFDPLVNLHNQDENSSTGIRVVMDAFDKILRAWPMAGIVIIHHTGKGNLKSPRGSSAIPGAVENIITISRPNLMKPEIVIDMRGRDMDDEQQQDNLRFIFEPHTGKHKPFIFTKKVSIPADERIPVEEEDTIDTNLISRLRNFFNKSPTSEYTQTEITELFKRISSYNTIKKALQDLCDADFLDKTGDGRRASPVVYKKK